MNENKENVKVLTKEDVIKLSNYEKRQDFLNNYESWGAWLDIPELNVQVFKLILPDDKSVFVTRFKNYGKYGGTYSSPVYRHEHYSAMGEGIHTIIDKLKNLKKEYLEEKKNETSDK